MKIVTKHSELFFITNMDTKIHVLQIDLIIDAKKRGKNPFVVIMDVSHLDETSDSLKKKIILSKKLSISRFVKVLNIINVNYIIKKYKPNDMEVDTRDRMLLAGCLSTVITLKRNPEVGLSDKIVLECASIATEVYKDAIVFCSGCDLVTIFNGRHFVENAIKKAANDVGSKINYVELAYNGIDYYIEDFQSHDLYKHTCAISRSENCDPAWAMAKFQDYSKTNIYNKPVEFEGDDDYYVFFGSSDDEYVETSLPYEKPFGQQLDSFELILKFLKSKDPKAKFFFRIHPNLRNINLAYRNNYMKKINSMGFDQIFDYNSEVNSRSLALKSKTVIVYGSTIGLESAILGKKVINLHETIYSGIGAVFEPKTMKELSQVFNEPLNFEYGKNALIFWGKMLTYGKKLKYITNTANSITYLGKRYEIGPITDFGFILMTIKKQLRRIYG